MSEYYSHWPWHYLCCSLYGVTKSFFFFLFFLSNSRVWSLINLRTHHLRIIEIPIIVSQKKKNRENNNNHWLWSYMITLRRISSQIATLLYPWRKIFSFANQFKEILLCVLTVLKNWKKYFTLKIVLQNIALTRTKYVEFVDEGILHVTSYWGDILWQSKNRTFFLELSNMHIIFLN